MRKIAIFVFTGLTVFLFTACPDLWMEPEPSNDAGLFSLVLSDGTIQPGFNANTSAYTATVDNAIETITVTPTSSDSNASIRVEGTTVASGTASGYITLSPGVPKEISISVTAEDGITIKAYTVTVTRTVNVEESLESPTISLASGTYTEPQTVTITHPNPDVRIYYTLDNTWSFDESTGILYEGSIIVSSHTTLIAKAFHDNFIPPSEVYTEWTERHYAIVSLDETNMISNGDFINGIILWRRWARDDYNAEASFGAVDGVFTINITNGGSQQNHVVTRYGPRVLLEQNVYYQFDFTAWAAGEREISAYLQESGIDNNGDGSSYSIYCGNSINLTTSPQQFSFTMCMDDIDDPQVDLRFNLGIETADVYIDNISLEKIMPVYLTTTDVPDANLRAVFEDVVGKQFSQITDLDLKVLDELEMDNGSIYDLTGVEYCTDLRSLDLCENQITSIAPIINLTNLETLQLWMNQIDDLSPISNLSKLLWLSLGENSFNLADLTVLTSLNFPDLQTLCLDNGYDLGGDTHPIDLDTDLTGLLNILDDLNNLSYLFMDDFYILDGQFSALYTQVLEPRKLEWVGLSITDGYLTDASLPLITNLVNLNFLDLFANNITNISEINNLINLNELFLAENEFTDLLPLQTMYDNGAFHDDGSWNEPEIDIRNCNLDLSPGSTNMAVVDYLLDHGVRVEYEEGNELGTGTVDITIH